MRLDRRFNQRISTDLPVQLTQLDDSVELDGQLQDISESGICSLGLTLYGHIVYSNPDDDGFRTGIFVEPALLDSSNITELVRRHLTTPAGQA
jgi:hypothetical protein